VTELSYKKGGPETVVLYHFQVQAILKFNVLAGYPIPYNQLLGSYSFNEDQKVSN